MDPSEVVADERATTVTDDPPPLNVLRSVQRESTAMPSLKHLCSTHIPLVRHIPPAVLPDAAGFFRRALQRAVDATDPYESVQRFTRVMMLPAAVLAAPKLRSIEASGAGHQTIVNIIKGRIIVWRIGRCNELWDDAMALELETPRSFEGKLRTEEYQKAYNIRSTITLNQEGAYGKATQAIQSAGILLPSTEVSNALTEKHPQDTPFDDEEYTLSADKPSPIQVA